MRSSAAHAADRAARDASLVLGLTLPGDTVLYLLLPLHASAFGVTLAEAGLLLAANRLVRIVGYGWVARAYGRRGPRVACRWAVAGSILAALGYALMPGLLPLLAARLLWGLSFAAMNIATQDLATAVAEGSPQRSGRSRAIIAAGPMLGLLAAAALAQATGPRPVFLALAALAALAFPATWRLPAVGDPRSRRMNPRLALPSRLDVWSFVQGLTLDGLFVVGLAVLATAALPETAALAAGAVLALRYAAEIVLGPPGGALAGRMRALPLLIGLSLAAATGLAAMGLGWLWAGAVAVVLLRGLLQPLPAPVLAATVRDVERVPALARLATWRDLGAGLGPLTAGLLLPVLDPALVYGVAALVLAISSAALASSGRPF